MCLISNKMRDEIIRLLESLHALPGEDVHTLNKKRRAKVAIRRLSGLRQRAAITTKARV